MSPTDVSPASASAFSAEDLLNLDEERLVQFMEHHYYRGSGFLIEDATGLEVLSNGQRAELREKLMAAGKKVEDARAPYALDFGEVVTKLDAVLRAGAAGNPHPVDCPPNPHYLPGRRDTTRNLSLLSKIAKDIGVYDERVRPWLKDPDTSGPEDWAIFSRQLDDWRAFNKWQWDNRGNQNDLGFSTFLEVNKRKYTEAGLIKMISSPGFEETLRRQWELTPKFVGIPGDFGFPAYVEAVKRRLAYHNFTEPFYLYEDP
ncbi:hypothetical protein F4679DRAFT_587327 [Xylaria curta]|nr:hypothetical protein F4679DRAFT_587327 [Xylaria curta]